jgi:hypothetical protein
MPNLLPDWTLTLPWDLGDWHLRASGRLFWALFLTIIGIAIIITLIKPPRMERPFSTKAGVAIFFVIVIGTLVLGKLIPDWQRTILWIGIFVFLAHLFMMLASRKPRDPEIPATWAECIAGAMATFIMMALAYAIVPHEWLTFANSQLQWGDSSKFVVTSNQDILGILPVHYPFAINYPALRDIVVTLIYVVFLGLNLKLFVMWQHRNDVPAATDAADAPVKRSRFGRPLQAMRRRQPEPATAGAATGAPTAAAPAEGG